MRKSLLLPLACLVAASALVAGCASAPAEPQKVSETATSCTGVAPATGTMLRKKEDCAPRAAMTPEELELDEIRRSRGTMVNGRGG